jgi:hypothetical protein
MCMKSKFRLRDRPALELKNLLRDWHHFMTSILRPGNLLPVLIMIFFLGFFSGVFSTYIPRTLFTQPVQTVTLMRTFPLGSTVVPKDTPQARDQFQPFGWSREPAVVVGYDTVTYKQQVILLCQVRMHQGEGDLLTVHPSWLERADELKKDQRPD